MMSSVKKIKTLRKLNILNATSSLKTASPGSKINKLLWRVTDLQSKNKFQKSLKWVSHLTKPIPIPLTTVHGTKTDGSLRVAQDFRELNATSRDNRYSMNIVNKCIEDIGRARSTIFSTLDIIHGF
jgi:hypothetical protein